MAKIWHKRILAGTQFYKDCPSKYKKDVKEMLLNDVVLGIITTEEFFDITGEMYPSTEEKEEAEEKEE